MPVSKNRRKSKRGRRRKENLAKVDAAFGGGGARDQFVSPPQPAPAATPPDVEPQGEGTTEPPGTG